MMVERVVGRRILRREVVLLVSSDWLCPKWHPLPYIVHYIGKRVPFGTPLTSGLEVITSSTLLIIFFIILSLLPPLIPFLLICPSLWVKVIGGVRGGLMCVWMGVCGFVWVYLRTHKFKYLQWRLKYLGPLKSQSLMCLYVFFVVV